VRGHLAVLAATVALAGCAGGTDAQPGPRVEWIEDALAAVAAARGGEPAYLEISATLAHVDAIVRDAESDGESAVLYRYADGELTGPIEPRDDPRPTFTSDDVMIDPDTIFDGLRDELDDPAIVDLAIRVEGGGQVIDATVASEQGGILLVLLGDDGTVLGLQAA
jgi:hypothetical protein